MNIVGREPQGIILAAEADSTTENLATRLRTLSGVEIYRPTALYATVRGVAPDLLAVCTQPGWRPSALIGRGAPWVHTGAAPMDAACESSSGLFVIYDPHNSSGGHELSGATIYDIVPTLLTLLGQPIPARLRGRALIEE